LLIQLGLDKSKIEELQFVPQEQVLKAMSASITASGKDNFRPVVNGRALPSHPFDPVPSALSADIPLMIGTCETEVSFDFSLNPKNFALTADQARARVAFLLDVSEAVAGRLMDAYRQTHPGASPSDLVIYVFTDYKYRLNDIKAAERKAAQGGAPVYMYLFTWKTPVLNGILKTPHTLCLPFVFGNVDIASGITGTGPERYALMHRVMDAWIAFARTGNPNHSGLPAWKPYSERRRSTMIFDNECRLASDPAGQDRIVISEIPEYVADAAGRR
jgi:para-nitrobenzyl esterase